MKKSVIYTIYLIVSLLVSVASTIVLTYAAITINAECTIFAVLAALITVFFLGCIYNQGKKAGVTFRFTLIKGCGLYAGVEGKTFTILLPGLGLCWEWYNE